MIIFNKIDNLLDGGSIVMDVYFVLDNLKYNGIIMIDKSIKTDTPDEWYFGTDRNKENMIVDEELKKIVHQELFKHIKRLEQIRKDVLKSIESLIVNINIWDDYYDDGYVPDGKIQETRIYVEQDVSQDFKEEVLSFFYEYLKNNFKEELNSVEISYGGDEIYLKHFTHKKRYEIMNKIEKSKIFFKDRYRLNIYSES